MGKMTKLAAVLGIAALALAACDDDNNSAGDGDPQDEFGSTFAGAFDASETDEPIDPEAGDAGEATDDPVEF